MANHAGLVGSLGVVESWNEWDTLREVLVGSLEQKQLEANQEPAWRRKEDAYSREPCPITNQLGSLQCLDEGKRQLENFVDVLKGEGVVVQRPTLNFDFGGSLNTPHWSATNMSGCTCPRDTFFLAGTHVIEAPMSWRSRYFEHMAWRDLLMGYFEKDRRMRWSAAPKPLLLEESYNPGREGRGIRNNEIFFDAADTRRFGKDYFVQSAQTCNDLGRDWIRRTVRSEGIRVQDFGFEDDGTYTKFTHLDARFVPISDDTAVWTRTDPPTQAMFDLFKANEWKLIEAAGRTQCRTPDDKCSFGIHLNMCTLSPMKCIAEAGETDYIKLLREEGVDVIPVEFSACYPFGGGLNCFTLDVYRDGPACKSYFPTLDEAEERTPTTPAPPILQH